VLDFDQLAELDGLISREVGEFLYAHASNIPASSNVVELGSYLGKSTCYLATGAQNGNGAQVFAVDAWSEEVSAWRNRILERLPSPLYSSVLQQLDKAEVREHVTVIRSLTALAADIYADALDYKPVGLLYIDGDHHFEAAVADYRAWHHHLTEEAVVIFDDYDSDTNPGVLAAVRALEESGEIVNVQKVAGRLAVARSGPKFGKRVPGVTK